MNPQRALLTAILAIGLGSTSAGLLGAQSYPSRTVTIVNPVPAGGATDTICRIIAEKLRLTLGQSFIVESRTGAGGSIAGEFVARAAPDGHVLLCTPEYLFISHLLNPKQSFDPRSLQAVGVHVRFPAVVTGSANLPVSNIAEMIAYARAHPGRLNYASQGIGSMAHITFEAIKMMAKVELVHVPYRGGAPAMTDMLAGQVDLYAAPLAGSISYIKSGKLKALGVTTPTRIAALPEVPALSEILPGLSVDTWNAFAAPPGTTKDITSKLSAAIAKVLELPDVRARFSDLQAEPLGSTPEQMKKITIDYVDRMAPIIAATNMRTN
jgi:tripartite-type tricarboxylate transporter receptor subunit TctC